MRLANASAFSGLVDVKPTVMTRERRSWMVLVLRSNSSRDGTAVLPLLRSGPSQTLRRRLSSFRPVVSVAVEPIGRSKTADCGAPLLAPSVGSGSAACGAAGRSLDHELGHCGIFGWDQQPDDNSQHRTDSRDREDQWAAATQDGDYLIEVKLASGGG